MSFIPLMFLIPIGYTNSEITVEPEDELTALAQLEEEEEDIEKKEYTQTELYDPEEIEPTELEELFPDAPYTVYYQDVE